MVTATMDRLTPKLDELYKEIILEHYRHPCGREPLERVDLEADGMNPLCGDEVKLSLQVKNNVIEKVHIEGHGCSISVASGSILADILKGKTIEEANKYLTYVKGIMHDKSSNVIARSEATKPSHNLIADNKIALPMACNDKTLEIGDLEVLDGVKKFPVRIKCALLPWTTFEEAMAGHKHVEIS